MKKFYCALLLALLLPGIGHAQSNLVISGLSPNGTLTWSNLVPNSTCRVEWASSPGGPWTNTWMMLTNIPTGSNATLSAQVPMFYRVVMFVPPPTPPPSTNTNTYTIDWCAVQFPKTAMVSTGAALTVYCQLYIAGLTTQTLGANDVAPTIRFQLGYGPASSAPATDMNWVWKSGSPNPGYSNPGSNNDEYYVTINAPSAAGTYDYCARFSGNSGTNWTYGDGSGIFNGNQVAPNRCVLTVTP